MSTRKYIREIIEINNETENTRELAGVIKPYIEQLGGMAELSDLNIMSLKLTVDGEQVEVNDVKCYEENNGYVFTDDGMALRQVTHRVIPEDHDLFRLLDKLPHAKEITLSIEYDIMHQCYVNEYGADFFKIHLKGMYDELSEYVTYKCCMHYPENDSLDTTCFYRFDKDLVGYAPYIKGMPEETHGQNWMIENFVFDISVEDDGKRQEVISVMREKLAKYGMADNVEDDGFGNASMTANGFIDNGKLADFIADIESVIAYASPYDSEPAVACTVFSFDEFIAVRIFAEEGKINTEYSCG